jgi:subtilase family serine protease
LAGYVDTAMVATVATGALEPGQSTTASFSWQAAPGTHAIKATADAPGTVSETDETNNSRTFSLTTLAADLTVQAITWTPAAPSKGDSVVLSVVVKNQGSLRSSQTKVDLYIDSTTRPSQNLFGIDPGGTATVSYSWIAQTGQHVLKATVDEDDNVVEGDESNNERTVTFTTLAPDLVIPDITWSPQNPSRDDVVTFAITVENQGSGRADPSLLRYYIDGADQPMLNVGAIEAGASVNITFTWHALPDEHTIRAVADAMDNLAENDDSNNEKTVTFSTLAPDLIVKDITWTPQSAAVGDTLTFTVIIKNQGSGDAPASMAIAYIDGGFAGHLDYPAIEAGAQSTATVTWQATPGAHTISVLADDDKRLEETHEDNNRLNRDIPLVPPDLSISAVNWSPEDPSIGDKVIFTVTVANQGDGLATSFHVAYYIDDLLLNPTAVAGVAHDVSVNVTCTWTAEAGRHTFRAVADAYETVAEANEKDNEYTVEVAARMADLAVGKVTWSPADLPAGVEVDFSIDITNLGTLGAGPSRVTYYVDGRAAGYADIDRLEAGSTVTAAFPWVVAEGNHSIDIVADASDQVLESDEANNNKLVNLPPPDLVVREITWSPAGAAEGDTVTFTATLENRGSGRSIGGTVGCYVDGELLADRDIPEIGPGGTATSSFDWEAGAGLHSIRMVADDGDRVTEADETNNQREAGFATMTPDFYFEEAGWSMADPLNDDKVTFKVVVRNRGTGAAAASRMEYSVDGGSPAYEDIDALAAGATFEVSFTASLEAGPHSLTATLDADDDIDELDEDNNDNKLEFSTIVPDLVVKSITWDPLEAAPGDRVTVTVKVENRGRDTAIEPRLTLKVDGSRAGHVDIPEIEVGDTASLDFTWAALPGLHELTVLADADGLIMESDETNNTRSRTLDVSGPGAPATSLAGPATASVSKGFLGDVWWIVLLIAALLGISAFVLAMRSFKKDR